MCFSLVYGPLIGSGITSSTDFIIARHNAVSGTLELIAQENTPIPGLSGQNFLNISSAPQVNRYGDVLLNDSRNLYVRKNGSYRRVYAIDDPIPELGSNARFASVQASILTAQKIADNGDVIFSADVQGATTPSIGFWKESSGVRTHLGFGQVPQGVQGLRFNLSNLPPNRGFINGRGDVLFLSPLAGTGVDSTNDNGLFLVRNGTTKMVLREGDSLVGYPQRVVDNFLTLSQLQFNDNGTAILSVDLRSGGRALVAISADGNVIPIAVPGEMVSFVDGTTARLMTFVVSSEFALNQNDEVVFVGQISLSGPNTTAMVLKAQIPTGDACSVDIDGSGSADLEDLFSFLGAWFAGAADFNHDQTTDVADIFAFLSAWFAGC